MNDEIKRRHIAFANMLKAYPWPTGDSGEKIVEHYDSVLCMTPAVSTRVIEMTCAAFSLGLVPGSDLARAPSAPFVRRVAQSYEWVADWLNHH